MEVCGHFGTALSLIFPNYNVKGLYLGICKDLTDLLVSWHDEDYWGSIIAAMWVEGGANMGGDWVSIGAATGERRDR